MRAKRRHRLPVGIPPVKRLKLNQPALYDAVRACGQTGVSLGAVLGLRQQQGFSALARAESVPEGSIYIERLEKLCDLIGFPKDQLFVEGGDQ